MLDGILGPSLSSRDTSVTPISESFPKLRRHSCSVFRCSQGLGPYGAVANEAPAWFTGSYPGPAVILEYQAVFVHPTLLDWWQLLVVFQTWDELMVAISHDCNNVFHHSCPCIREPLVPLYRLRNREGTVTCPCDAATLGSTPRVPLGP